MQDRQLERLELELEGDDSTSGIVKRTDFTANSDVLFDILNKVLCISSLLPEWKCANINWAIQQTANGFICSNVIVLAENNRRSNIYDHKTVTLTFERCDKSQEHFIPNSLRVEQITPESIKLFKKSENIKLFKKCAKIVFLILAAMLAIIFLAPLLAKLGTLGVIGEGLGAAVNWIANLAPEFLITFTQGIAGLMGGVLISPELSALALTVTFVLGGIVAGITAGIAATVKIIKSIRCNNICSKEADAESPLGISSDATVNLSLTSSTDVSKTPSPDKLSPQDNSKKSSSEASPEPTTRVLAPGSMDDSQLVSAHTATFFHKEKPLPEEKPLPVTYNIRYIGMNLSEGELP